MTREDLIAILAAERDRACDEIQVAYWRFTRCARAAPPSLVVPWAYQVRNEMDRRLRLLRCRAR